MAQHTHELRTHVPVERIWEFVRDMDRWAPLLLGYESHHKRSEAESLWKLRGDLGALSRTADFRVQITEWSECERVRFRIEGVVEAVTGEGSFELERLDSSNAAPATARHEVRSRLARLWIWLVRRLLGRRHSHSSPASGAPDRPDASRLCFSLRLTPHGPMAPMLDAMLGPVMIATAEDLARRIATRLEADA